MRTKSKIKNIYQADLNEIIKADLTSDKDLHRLAKKMGINDLKVGWLSDYVPTYKGPQILNLGSSSRDQNGTHWVCAYGDDYFDSFGLPPPKGLEHLNWVPLQYQDIREGMCGQWSLLFIWFKKKNELDKFYRSFNPLPTSQGRV